MKRVIDGVAVSAAGLNVELFALSKIKVSEVVGEIRQKFCDGRQSGPLWQCLRGGSVYEPTGWARISGFTHEPLLVLIDDIGGMSGFTISDSGRLTDLLNASELFVFYVTNEGVDFTISFNDHDFLIGTGSAKEWVEAPERPTDLGGSEVRVTKQIASTE